jgi:drug/metabolite transporter (DMT)-like permease
MQRGKIACILWATGASTVAKGLMFQPALGIVVAFLLLGEVPSTIQWIAGR